MTQMLLLLMICASCDSKYSISFPSIITDNCKKHGHSKNMEPTTKMPMISTLILLVYCMTDNFLNDLDAIATATWLQSKMVSATYCLCSTFLVRCMQQFKHNFAKARVEDNMERKEYNLPSSKKKGYIQQDYHIHIYILCRLGVFIRL